MDLLKAHRRVILQLLPSQQQVPSVSVHRQTLLLDSHQHHLLSQDLRRKLPHNQLLICSRSHRLLHQLQSHRHQHSRSAVPVKRQQRHQMDSVSDKRIQLHLLRCSHQQLPAFSQDWAASNQNKQPSPHLVSAQVIRINRQTRHQCSETQTFHSQLMRLTCSARTAPLLSIKHQQVETIYSQIIKPTRSAEIQNQQVGTCSHSDQRIVATYSQFNPLQHLKILRRSVLEAARPLRHRLLHQTCSAEVSGRMSLHRSLSNRRQEQSRTIPRPTCLVKIKTNRQVHRRHISLETSQATMSRPLSHSAAHQTLQMLRRHRVDLISADRNQHPHKVPTLTSKEHNNNNSRHSRLNLVAYSRSALAAISSDVRCDKPREE